MRIGTFCYATSQGLGILAKDFYDHGVVTDAMPIMHGSRPNHDSWYPNAQWISSLKDFKQRDMMIDFAKSMDVMLFFETPFWWPIIDHCKQAGVKTALMVMYECMPRQLPVIPDLILCPSLLDLQYYPTGKLITVPVDQKWKLRERAIRFIHNAGHGGLQGRNGTIELMEAWGLVKTPAELIIRSQSPIKGSPAFPSCSQHGTRIKFELREVPREELFSDGDVFVFPEKFNGLSLPLQEAYASGMCIAASERFPMTGWLPNKPLIPVTGYLPSSIGGCNSFNKATIRPEDIASKIDELYDTDISEFSKAGKAWAEENSWDKLKPKYLEVLSK